MGTINIFLKISILFFFFFSQKHSKSVSQKASCMPLPGPFQEKLMKCCTSCTQLYRDLTTTKMPLLLWSSFTVIIIICPRTWPWSWPIPGDGGLGALNNTPPSARKPRHRRLRVDLGWRSCCHARKRLAWSSQGEVQLSHVWWKRIMIPMYGIKDRKTWVIWDWFQAETIKWQPECPLLERGKENRNWTLWKVHSKKRIQSSEAHYPSCALCGPLFPKSAPKELIPMVCVF